MSWDSMIDGYIACALWSSHDGEEMLESDLTDDAYTALSEQAMAFFRANEALLSVAYYASTEESVEAFYSQVGHDLWLTRNGHGTGFWDREESYYGKANQELLTKLAKAYGSVDLYRDEDGSIHT